MILALLGIRTSEVSLAFIQILFAMHIGFCCWSTLWKIFKICKNASISEWEISENKDHEGLNLKKLENMISW